MRPMSACKVSQCENWGHGKVTLRELMGWRMSHQWKLRGLLSCAHACNQGRYIWNGAMNVFNINSCGLHMTNICKLVSPAVLYDVTSKTPADSNELAFLQMTLDVYSLGCDTFIIMFARATPSYTSMHLSIPFCYLFYSTTVHTFFFVHLYLHVYFLFSSHFYCLCRCCLCELEVYDSQTIKQLIAYLAIQLFLNLILKVHTESQIFSWHVVWRNRTTCTAHIDL